ncbi:adenosylcobinamide amidohydrolase [Anaerosalibacter bizertensis]|uniref:adenosylcobinamide amidohydrolase n=1 Tax=Anaerosalibacter bizertensis TaxID=932217 RepID=UPI001D00EC66|nr:adenosylcobinamide amidohydrolase [Anaerosalibacter bizertensis]MCB5560188.1 adenosylcobinamide amidohydrolase [Anaerosalibacter bizertensis]
MIYRLSTNDEVHRYKKSIIIPFKGNRKVLSTSPLNGGYREDLKAIFNNDFNPGAGMLCDLKAPTYEGHMAIIAKELGFDSKSTAGIGTAASMEEVAIVEKRFKDLTVTAIVTGGIEVNGGRVGDPATFYEEEGKIVMIKPGTINIILIIDANLPSDTLTRALITSTEAKTAALQELVSGSNFSYGIATGSGTDGAIIVANSESKLKLTNAGKHSKLGELIGVSVKEAVKEALYKQTGLCGEKQHSFLRRIKRFGVNEDILFDIYENMSSINRISKPEFIHKLHIIDKKSKLVVPTSLYLHLIDQLDWELISNDEAIEEGEAVLKRIKNNFNISKEIDYNLSKINLCIDNEVIEYMVKKLIYLIVHIVIVEEL